jgi:hypothetical protein
MDKKVDIGVSCTWGDGPDILITLDGKPFICYEDPKNHPPPRGQWVHGYVSKGSMDFTQAEARVLAAQLISAADACRDIEAGYAEHEQAVHNAEVEHMNGEAKKLHAHLRKKLLPNEDTQGISDVITDLRTGKIKL